MYANIARMKQYIQLLKSEPILKKLSTIQLITYFGAWFSNIAIYTLLIEMNVSTLVIAFTAALHFMAGVLQAPFSGSIIDRISPKRVMLMLLATEIVATLLLLLVSDISHLWLLFLLIFIRMAAASFYFSAEMALLPKILKGNSLQKANEIHSIIWSVSYTLGMAISGFVVYLLGVKIAFIIDALLFVISFFLLYGLDIKVKTEALTQTLLETMKDALTYISNNPKALHLMLAHAFVGLSAFDTLVVLLVDQYYASIIAVSLALGLIHASRALGLIIGPILLGKHMNRDRVVQIFIAQAVVIWIWSSVMDNFYLSLLASVLVGFFTTTLWSYTYTLLQTNIDRAYYGRVVAYNDMLFLLCAAFVSILTGVLADFGLSLESIASIMGCGFLLGALYFSWILKRYDVKDIDSQSS